MRYGTRVEQEYRNRCPSGHWFDEAALRFFDSFIGEQLWNREVDGWYFVSSEQQPASIPVNGGSIRQRPPRRYSARVMDADGNIETVGPFCERSRSWATRVVRMAARRGLVGRVHACARIIQGCVMDAQKAWEADGGSIDDKVREHREAADNWAKSIGYGLRWDCITPFVVTDTDTGEGVDWCRFVSDQMLDEYEVRS